MSRVMAYVCECGLQHDPDCKVYRRLRIKERICNERGIISHVPEDVEKEIDRELRIVCEEEQQMATWPEATQDAARAALGECKEIITQLNVIEQRLNELPSMKGINHARQHVTEAKMWVNDAYERESLSYMRNR